MNWRTTVAMIFLGLGLAGWWLGESGRKGISQAPTGTKVLAGRTAAELIRIEISRTGSSYILERKGGSAKWSLPGNWPTRDAEVGAWVEMVLGLRTRFAPMSASEVATTGLANPMLKVKLGFGKTDNALAEDVTLEFAEPDFNDTSNRFAIPTYVRVQPSGAVMRIGPGVISQLDHPVEYFQQRRLFVGERLSTQKDGSLSSSQKGEKLLARAVTVEMEEKGKKLAFSIERKEKEWMIGQPVGQDYLEPKAGESLLTAIPDLWAEKFLKIDLVKAGLDKPERTIKVTREDGSDITLRIGSVSSRKESRRPRPTPPGTPPGMPAQEEVIVHEMRHAKIDGNDQIFEIQGDRLKDVFVSIDQLRDPQVARLNTQDVNRLEIRSTAGEIHLVRENQKWRIEKPVVSDADNEKVQELLTKVGSLEAKGADIIDQPKLAEYGLEKPAVSVQLTVVEELKGDVKSGEEKKKSTRTVLLSLGKHEPRLKKVYLQRQGVTRVDHVEDSLLTLLGRPVMAYRGKRALDLQGIDIQSLDLFAKDGKVRFQKEPQGKWTIPDWKDVAIDDPKVAQLASSLAGLEALEYVDENPSEKDLKEKFGLAEPALKVEIGLNTKDAKPRKLSVGNPRADKSGNYARLDGAGPVFVIGLDTVQNLKRDALSYIPMDFWKLLPEEILTWTLERQGKSFTLDRRENAWRVTKPFEAEAFAQKLESLLPLLAAPKAENFVDVSGKDAAKFGLDKPLGKLSVTDKEKKQRVLVVGGKTAENSGLHYARLGESGPVALIPKTLAELFQTDALELLDPVVLKVDPAGISKIQLQGKNQLALVRKDGGWQLEQPEVGAIPSDLENTLALTSLWFNLKVEKFAGYGDAVDLKPFGLDKPQQRVSIEFTPGEKKLEPRILFLGDAPKDGSGGVYARFDKEKAVFLLGQAQAKILARDHLAYVSRQVWKWSPDLFQGLTRKGSAGTLDISRQDDAWKILQPAGHKADDKTLLDIGAVVADLKLDSVVAYQAKDLKPYGLDAPHATLTFQEGAKKRILLVGKEVEGKAGQRFAMVENEKTVGVLPRATLTMLMAGPLFYRDRAIARFPDADQLHLERGPRKAAFSRIDGNWKLTAPISADADQQLIDDSIDLLARLRADELIAEKPTPEELKKYGLEKPAILWSARSAGKSVLDLQLGKRDATGARVYAMIPGRDLVFLLEPRLTALLEGEFRTRTIWNPGLDAVQVESIKYSGSQATFELVKKDNQWQVNGKPGDRVNDANLNLTLSSLAGLKLERFVMDQGASLNLFGLDPVEWTLELGTPQGKRILLLGRQEGGTGKLYARLAEGKPGEVFLLSEADALLILKPYSWFQRKEK